MKRVAKYMGGAFVATLLLLALDDVLGRLPPLMPDTSTVFDVAFEVRQTGRKPEDVRRDVNDIVSEQLDRKIFKELDSSERYQTVSKCYAELAGSTYGVDEDWNLSDAYAELAATVATTPASKEHSLELLASVYASRGEATRARGLVPKMQALAASDSVRRAQAKDVETAIREGIRRTKRMKKNEQR